MRLKISLTNAVQLQGITFLLYFALGWILYPASNTTGLTQYVSATLLLLEFAALIATAHFKKTSFSLNTKSMSARQSRSFNIVGGVQALVIVTSVVLLIFSKHAAYIPSIVSAIVGTHFIPLANIFKVKAYYATGLGLIAVGAGTTILSLYSTSDLNHIQQLATICTSALLFLTALSLYIKRT